MKKTLVMAGAMLALSVSLAAAQGINLSWNECGTAGNATQSFDCASTTGIPFSMYASFIPPPNINQFLGISSQIDITSLGALPEWWKHGTAYCRGTSGLTVTFADFPGACIDFYQNAAVGGFAYDVAFDSPNRARLRVQAAVPIDNAGPVDPAFEYYAYKVNVQRSKSFGTGSCAGCTTPMCIVLNSIQLFQPLDVGNDPELSNPANSNYVTWQAPTISGCPLSTPTRNSSWGQVKSLYR